MGFITESIHRTWHLTSRYDLLCYLDHVMCVLWRYALAKCHTMHANIVMYLVIQMTVFISAKTLYFIQFDMYVMYGIKDFGLSNITDFILSKTI